MAESAMRAPPARAMNGIRQNVPFMILIMSLSKCTVALSKDVMIVVSPEALETIMAYEPRASPILRNRREVG